MKCFACLLAYQMHQQEIIHDAEFVYDGKSLCGQHVNSQRDLPNDFDRYSREELGLDPPGDVVAKEPQTHPR